MGFIVGCKKGVNEVAAAVQDAYEVLLPLTQLLFPLFSFQMRKCNLSDESTAVREVLKDQ